jgi:hypothetical protein
MDHSMGFLISRCADKAHMSLSLRCPSPPPIPEYTSTSTNDLNEISQRARADRSFGPQAFTTFAPKTLVYTLPPEPGSRTSSGLPLIPSYSSSLCMGIFVVRLLSLLSLF